MHHSHNRYRGACFASLLAGPIFLCALALVALAETIDPVPTDIGALRWLPGLLFVSTLFGALIAIVPNLIGTGAMLWVDDHLDDAGLPIVWALVGGLPVGIAAAFLSSAPEFFAPVFGLTGAASAVICWWGAQQP
jgi:hypothetical protein